jgi:quinol-cytochrome oxidoreductase complex cytochrome b subunit
MTAETKDLKEDSVPFYPEHVLTEAKVVLGIVAIAIIIGIIGSIYPVGLQEPADPMVTPSHAKPEWYFFFLYEILKFVPKEIGPVIAVGGLILLALWPFVVDRKPDHDKKQIRNRFILVVIVMTIVNILTYFGGQ